MNDELKALALRAVACDGWRETPGMRFVHPTEPGFCRCVGEVGGELAWARVSAKWMSGLPDLTDPPTLRCLLELVREAWGCDGFRRLGVEPAGRGCCVVVRNGRHRPPSRSQGGWDLCKQAHPPRGLPQPFGRNVFDTEAEALVAALEAAPKREG